MTIIAPVIESHTCAACEECGAAQGAMTYSAEIAKVVCISCASRSIK